VSLLFSTGEGGQDKPTSQRWSFFRIRNIYNDLMKL
jgi:hypothetical protein